MAPEIRACVPPDSIQKVESFLSQIEGAEILSVRELPREGTSEIDPDNLASKLREELNIFPPETRFRIFLRDGLKKRKPPVWSEFVNSLNSHERRMIGKTLRTLARHELSIEEAKKIDWRVKPYVWQESPRIRSMLMRAFPTEPLSA